MKVSLQELRDHFSKYVELLKKGETLLLCERNLPIGVLAPLAACAEVSRPAPGLFREQIFVDSDFFAADEPLSRSFEDAFLEMS